MYVDEGGLSYLENGAKGLMLMINGEKVAEYGLEDECMKLRMLREGSICGLFALMMSVIRSASVLLP